VTTIENILLYQHLSFPITRPQQGFAVPRKTVPVKGAPLIDSPNLFLQRFPQLRIMVLPNHVGCVDKTDAVVALTLGVPE